MKDFDYVGAGTFLAISSYGTELLPENLRDSSGPIGVTSDYDGFMDLVSSGSSSLSGSLSNQSGKPWKIIGQTELDAANSAFATSNTSENLQIWSNSIATEEVTIGAFSADGLYQGLNTPSYSPMFGRVADWEPIFADRVQEARDAQALLATTGIDGKTVLVLAFRGTDSEDDNAGSITNGQTFTGKGLSEYYQGLRPLVEAASKYAEYHNINDIIVSGHSLAGAMVDVFSLVDAKRLFLDKGMDLKAFALASPGVDKDLAHYFSLDSNYAKVNDFLFDEIEELYKPSFYQGISHDQDRVGHPDKIDSSFGGGALNFGGNFVPSTTIKSNLRFSDGFDISLPNINNLDVDYDGRRNRIWFCCSVRA